jgi:small subunit ribosomal protein S3
MGQKVNPHGLRVGIINGWDSVWYAEKDFSDLLVEDDKIRKFIKKRIYQAGVSKIQIARSSNRVKIAVHVAKPGIVIGRGGKGIDELQNDIQKLVKKPEQRVLLNVEEVKRPELNSQLVAEEVAKNLEARMTFRRAMQQAMNKTMKMGAKGIKVAVSGRLGGADIARTEQKHEGTIPLQTLRAEVDYGFAEANTTYGKLGVKIWIYKGEVLPVRAKAREGGGGNVNA